MSFASFLRVAHSALLIDLTYYVLAFVFRFSYLIVRKSRIGNSQFSFVSFVSIIFVAHLYFDNIFMHLISVNHVVSSLHMIFFVKSTSGHVCSETTFFWPTTLYVVILIESQRTQTVL